jgi:hypothetical protein
MKVFSFEEITVPPPEPGIRDWNSQGVVIVKNFFPEELMENYEKCWIKENKTLRNRPSGWPDPCPYMRHQELLDILTYQPLSEILETLIQEPAGLHLNLTGWVSTERNWHQDSYLNPAHVGDSYAAIWIALDEIHEDSGPFQYIPGSHRWRQVSYEKIINALPPEQRDHRWPKYSEAVLTELFEKEIEKNNSQIISHTPSRGDLLIWHGRLLHRGSKAKIFGMERRSLIAHYSGIKSRHEMPKAVQHKNDGWYFPIHTDMSRYE